MSKIIEMEDLRHLNLFAKITKILTRHCFYYNEGIVFLVPKSKLSKALGEGAQNLKRLSQILRKRVKIVAQPQGIEDVERFIKIIVGPVEFKEVEVKEDEIILTAGMQNKAALLGRNKRRLIEMKGIIKDYFGKEFRIV